MIKTGIKNFLSRCGVRANKSSLVLERKKIVGGMHYSTVLPFATYSPWLDDEKFVQTYEIIKSNTLVDRYRCFELWDLLGQAGHLPGDILEVGVWRGGTGALIAARSAMLGMAKKVYLCDTFAGVVKASGRDTSYMGGEHSDTSEAIVRQILRQVEVSDAVILKGIFPDDFHAEMQGVTFCFVHIDVDVNESARQIMSFVWPRLACGGLVIFDDYGFDTCDGIAKLMVDYRGNADKLVLHNLNGHAVLVKIA